MKPHELRRIPFKVEIAGVIEIMGRSLYSDRATPIRELIQNAHDGIRRRRLAELDFLGKIRIEADPQAGTLSVEDDGVGLDEAEAERYLGTVGVSLTGALKSSGARGSGATETLIGQFGIGLLSGFLLAERIEVQSLKPGADRSVIWIAGDDTDILIGEGTRTEPGTKVTLHLRPEALQFAQDADVLIEKVKHFADYLEVPIFLGVSQKPVNSMGAAWLEPTVDEAELRADLFKRFGEEEGLAVLRVEHSSAPRVRGGLYVTADRTPGFTSDSTVHVTLKRMLISTSVRDLLPPWAAFLRGALELADCIPTANREDLVRDESLERVRRQIAESIFKWMEDLAERDDETWQAICEWHRYSLVGSALDVGRLRRALRKSLRWNTSAGELTFDEFLARSESDPLLAPEADYTVWFNIQRRQEPWIDSVFDPDGPPCVHCLRSFEVSLLSQLIHDASESGKRIQLLAAKLDSPGFATGILGVRDHEPVAAEWQEFLGLDGARVFSARGGGEHSSLALVDESQEVKGRIASLREASRVPPGFRALIEREMASDGEGAGEVLLDLNHLLVQRALDRSPRHPLANVLRVQVANALESAGAKLSPASREIRKNDLDWVSETLP